MIVISPKHRIFLAIAPIDFRNGIDGIARLCKNKYNLNPMTGHYFIFRNKRKTDIKILFYDSQGFALYQKRLSKGRFNNWPKVPNEIVTLTPAQAHILIFNGNPQTALSAKPWRDIIDDP